MRSPDCNNCPIGDAVERRAFMRGAVAAVLTALGALGGHPARALALPVRFINGLGTRTHKAYPMPTADGVFIDKDESVIVARFSGCVYAFSLACPHQNTALRWDAGNGRFQCPKHKSRYQPDGTFIEGRATRGLDRFAVTREAEQLLVNLDALYRQDKESAQWTSAFVQV